MKIDLNSDLGEGMPNETDILSLVTSCNIACGGHIGDANSMTSVVKLAMQNNVKIGAHPSYPDKDNFGRLSLSISENELTKTIRGQINALQTIVLNHGAILSHIKPHGALYNDIAKDDKIAISFINAILPYKFLCLYVPYKSVIAKLALESGFKIKYEAFADRNYNINAGLVSRKLPNAVLRDKKKVLEHVKNMLINGKVKTIEAEEIEIKAETICVHGDTKQALAIVSYLHTELPKWGIKISNE